MTATNSATPSTSAAAMIIAVWIRAVASGWRAMPSVAEPPIRPMPMPAPTTASPAARPAPIRPKPLSAPAAAADTSVLVLRPHQPDKYARQQREHEGLQEGHEQLQQHDAGRERGRRDPD